MSSGRCKVIKKVQSYKKRLLKKWIGAGARLLKRCKDAKKGAQLKKRGAKLEKRLLKKWFGAGARLLERCKVEEKNRAKLQKKKKGAQLQKKGAKFGKRLLKKVVWCRCKVTRPERVKWQWVKSGERHSTVGSGDTREEEAKITTRKRNSTSTSSTDY